MNKSHEPFKIRERIVFVGFGMFLLFGFFFDDLWIGLSAYAVSVTLADTLLTYSLKLKSSTYALKKRLLAEQHISFKNFDKYCKMITNIRLINIGASVLISLLLLMFHWTFFKTFSLSYLILTFMEVNYLRHFTKIKKPVLVRFYELSPEEKKEVFEKSYHEQLMFDPKYTGAYGNIFTRKDR